MPLNIKIQDNFLDTKSFESIKKTLFDRQFPWYYTDNVVKNEKINNHFLLSHGFYDYTIISPYYKYLIPLLIKLKIKSFIRIKANLYVNQGKVIEHLKHADFKFSHKSALYSVNTTNGYTRIGDKKIQGLSNRLLQFYASNQHASSTCTDQPVRINIVVNYF